MNVLEVTFGRRYRALVGSSLPKVARCRKRRNMKVSRGMSQGTAGTALRNQAGEGHGVHVGNGSNGSNGVLTSSYGLLSKWSIESILGLGYSIIDTTRKSSMQTVSVMIGLRNDRSRSNRSAVNTLYEGRSKGPLNRLMRFLFGSSKGSKSEGTKPVDVAETPTNTAKVADPKQVKPKATKGKSKVESETDLKAKPAAKPTAKPTAKPKAKQTAKPEGESKAKPKRKGDK